MLASFVTACVFTSIFSVALGLFVYVKGPTKRLNMVWALMSLSIGLWGLGLGLMSNAGSHTEAVFYLRWIHYLGGICVPAFYLHFISVVLDIEAKNRKIIYSGYLICVLLQFANIGGELAGVQRNVGIFRYYTVGRFFYPFFAAWFFSCVAYSVFLLYKHFRRAAGKRKTQFEYMLIASIIGFAGGSTAFLPVFNIHVHPFGVYFMFLYTLLISYAITRYQLMDIEIVIKKTLVFAGLFVASYSVFAGFAYLGSVLFENVVRNRWLAMVPSVFVIALMLRPLENLLRDVTDKYLFQKKYDYRRLLRTFSDEVLTVLDLNMLVHLTVNTLVETIKLDNAGIFLYDEETEVFRTAASAGQGYSEYVLNGEEALIARMRKDGRHILLAEAGRRRALRADIKKKMHELGSVLVIPLMHRESMVGIMSFGKKKSDEDFTQDDIDILLPLARTLSIAIVNAQLFEKLSEAQAQAAQREKMAVIGTLSAGINHEICNPLGIARGQCEMFLLNLAEGVYKDKSLAELLEKAKEIMKKVMHETDRATLITRKLSSFAKPAKGEIEGNVQVGKELEKVISLVEHELELDNITITRDIEDDLPSIFADRKQIQEIFFNLIRNAVQSIRGEGEITLRGTLGVDKKVHIDVEDTGAGISGSHLPRIFDPFFTTKDPGKGTGLGLFIVKQIVERNNGQITAWSDPGEKTVFHLVFNAVEPDKTGSSEQG